jgi:hypothetical protein
MPYSRGFGGRESNFIVADIGPLAAARNVSGAATAQKPVRAVVPQISSVMDNCRWHWFVVDVLFWRILSENAFPQT